jgi:hypothetical protein
MQSRRFQVSRTFVVITAICGFMLLPLTAAPATPMTSVGALKQHADSFLSSDLVQPAAYVRRTTVVRGRPVYRRPVVRSTTVVRRPYAAYRPVVRRTTVIRRGYRY